MRSRRRAKLGPEPAISYRQLFQPTLRDGEEEGRGREAGGEEVSDRFGASNEPSIGSGRRVRASTRRYRRPLRRPRLACGEGPVLVVLGKHCKIPRAAACGNAAVARAHLAAREARPRVSFHVPPTFPNHLRDGEEEVRGREAGGQEVSNRFGASNEPSIGSGRRVRTSTRRYRRPLRRPRLACGKGPVLVVLGKRCKIPRAAACGNAAVARAQGDCSNLLKNGFPELVLRAGIRGKM